MSIDELFKDHMDVISHDDDRVQINFDLMFVKAAFEHDGAGEFRENPTTLRAKRQEVRLGIPL